MFIRNDRINAGVKRRAAGGPKPETDLGKLFRGRSSAAPVTSSGQPIRKSAGKTDRLTTSIAHVTSLAADQLRSATTLRTGRYAILSN